MDINVQHPLSYMDDKLQWMDASINMEEPSLEIISEENSGSECGNDPVVRPIPVLQIWDPIVLRTQLEVSCSAPSAQCILQATIIPSGPSGCYRPHRLNRTRKHSECFDQKSTHSIPSGLLDGKSQYPESPDKRRRALKYCRQVWEVK